MDIKSFSTIEPMIYAYTTPYYKPHDGWIKIGYTEAQTPEERIKEQSYTADIECVLEWQDFAKYKKAPIVYFTDKDFHSYLTVQKNVERKPGKEWFKISPNDSRAYFDDFAMRKIPISESKAEYKLRDEQEQAVEVTKMYFENGGTEFLWNAKPRFGKVLTSYDLIEKMDLQKVLIVTNRPAVSNAWHEDFVTFVSQKGKYSFVSDNDSLKGKPFVMTRDQYVSSIVGEAETGMIAFESLQGLKGSKYFRKEGEEGGYDKLSWISKDFVDKFGNKQTFEFDLLIVDEAQEGVDTMKTDEVFKHIARKYTLYLSGTPFKALADEKFAENQIFNWTYADEQEAKQNWSSEDFNPYERLPQLNMYTYQLSDMIFEKLERGVDLSDDENVEYAFDLNEFFSTDDSGKFNHEDDVRKFLHTLVTNEKYPFSTEELRSEMAHTIWLLEYVKSAKALAKLLKEDPVFSEYEIVLAAGDGKLDDDSENLKSYDKVKKAIKEHDKTITLSVGQLTVGVTIPEWSGILMLCNLESASAYIQAAFRVQNPCSYTSEKDGRMRKERAYVFDFDPARTLVIYDEFANNLSRSTSNGKGSTDDRKGNIQKLLNFFPIISEDDEGKMMELDAEKVLSIPRRIKSKEVVKRGFMSNFLFKNIGNIFGAPKAVEAIMQKLKSERPPKRLTKEKAEIGLTQIAIDDNGNVEVGEDGIKKKVDDVLGDKIYAAQKDIPNLIDDVEIAPSNDVDTLCDSIEKYKEKIIARVKEDVIEPAVAIYKPRTAVKNKIVRDAERKLSEQLDVFTTNFKEDVKAADTQHLENIKMADTKKDIENADAIYMKSFEEFADSLKNNWIGVVKREADILPKDIAIRIERNEKEDKKKSLEESVREHLRGFTRTIPSFIMAYGEGTDGNLTIDNFDKKTEEDVFLEVTGITVEDFRFLRDGGDYTDEETGETKHFDGQLFDEIVFNDSVKEFWRLKKSLANYFRDDQKEDIFDYIPPQKTNQIFTPRWVVEKMVDELEEENPGCFDDDTKTFADLYMKSGLYIAEIVKRLYKSEKMIEKHPDDGERIRHILTKQVYGMAPTRIIYLISTNFILGFDEKLKIETKNFVQADAAEAAKNGTLDELVQECFPDGNVV